MEPLCGRLDRPLFDIKVSFLLGMLGILRQYGECFSFFFDKFGG